MAPTAHLTKSKRRRKWRLALVPALVALLLVGGTATLNYPDQADWVNQARFNQLVSGVKAETLAPDPATVAAREQALDQARRYNDGLTSGALINADQRIPVGAAEASPEAHAMYKSSLNHDPGGIMASIIVPKIDIELPIYHGTSDATLLKGVGHLEGTSLPVGGVGTHSVLTAHRGLASAKLFTDLDQVAQGDEFVIAVEGEALAYRVFNVQVVDPHDTTAIQPDSAKDLVTLVTCTPLGVNSHRILVTGERIIPTPDDAEQAAKADPPLGFPWWIVFDALALVFGALYVWRAGLYRPAAPGDPESSETSSLEQTITLGAPPTP